MAKLRAHKKEGR